MSFLLRQTASLFRWESFNCLDSFGDNGWSLGLPQHHQIVEYAGEEESYEPCVVVEKGDCGNEATDQCGDYADDQCNQRDGVDAAAIFVDSSAAIERVCIELCFANKEVVGDHDACDRAKQAGVADEPSEDVAAEGLHQFPRHHGEAEKS